MKALDMSFGTADVTQAWCEGQRAAGVELLIADAWMGAQSPVGVEAALRAWRAAGGLTAAYYVPHAYRPAAYHLDQAQTAIGAEWEHLAFMAIDIEDIDPRWHRYPAEEQWQAEHVRESANLVQARGGRPIVYSGPGAWAWSLLPPLFTDLGLWKAHYGVPVSFGATFGGWTDCVGHQHTNTTDVDGIPCDLNVFDDAWVAKLGSSPTKGADSPTYPLVPDDVRINAGNVLHGWGELLQTRRVTNPELSQLLAECGEALRAMH